MRNQITDDHPAEDPKFGSGRWKPVLAPRHAGGGPRRRTPNDDVGLVARGRELANIDRILQHARSGSFGALALRGEPGVGKSALIEAAIARAPEFRAIQIRGDKAAGVLSSRAEWPLGLTGLVQELDLDEDGLISGSDSAPEVVVDAIATNLGEILDQSQVPLLLTVDDCQQLPEWLVRAIVEAVSVRLRARPVSLVIARGDAPHLNAGCASLFGLTTHQLRGLNAAQSSTLLAARFEQLPDDQVLARLLAGTRGNPLALIDVCGRLTKEQLIGWHPLPDPLPVGDGVVAAFDVTGRLPDNTRAALTVAALSKAPRETLAVLLAFRGHELKDLDPAIDAGVLVENGSRIEFSHPLVAAAVFYGSSTDDKRAALKAVSDELASQNAIESSTYIAVADAEPPDDSVARRFGEAARTALDRADPAAAAQHEELAGRFASTDDAVVAHLASAAGLWRIAGVRDRARYCVDSASALEAGDVAGAQLQYVEAWLADEQGESAVADKMVDAAERCIADAPHRAVMMLVDAAAWKLLANDPAPAEKISQRAVELAANVSTQAEIMAAAMQLAVSPREAPAATYTSSGSRVSLLIGQTEQFPASAEVAFVIGLSLQRQGLQPQADRWARWLERCSLSTGDTPLRIAAQLLWTRSHLLQHNLADAAEVLELAIDDIDLAGSSALTAWVFSLSVQISAAAGDYEHGFRDSARLFAMPPTVGVLPRVLATLSLASLELQRGRLAPARAWVATSVEDLLTSPSRQPDAEGERGLQMSAAALMVAPIAATLSLLANRSDDDSQPLLASMVRTGQLADGWHGWLTAACADDQDSAVEDLEAARPNFAEAPATVAYVDLCYAAKLLDSDRIEEALRTFEQIRNTAQATGAHGIAKLASQELQRFAVTVPAQDTVAYAQPQNITALNGHRRESAVPEGVGEPASAWQISLLGNFAIRRHGRQVNLPPSLATEAIKIVALKKQITVDEFVEILWEEASPGVGVRRLRNVLWRIRSACGEVVVRDGQFVRLAHDAVTDLGRFEELADQALARDATPETASRAAQAALRLYRGELLPANRYDDWATGSREIVSRTKVSLLELLVDDALTHERSGEALTHLDRLAREDPYDEAPLVRMAEIYLQTGNRRRALESLDRAEAIFTEMRIPPTAAATRLRDALSRRHAGAEAS